MELTHCVRKGWQIPIHGRTQWGRRFSSWWFLLTLNPVEMTGQESQRKRWVVQSFHQCILLTWRRWFWNRNSGRMILLTSWCHDFLVIFPFWSTWWIFEQLVNSVVKGFALSHWWGWRNMMKSCLQIIVHVVDFFTNFCLRLFRVRTERAFGTHSDSRPVSVFNWKMLWEREWSCIHLRVFKLLKEEGEDDSLWGTKQNIWTWRRERWFYSITLLDLNDVLSFSTEKKIEEESCSQGISLVVQLHVSVSIVTLSVIIVT